MVVVLAGIILYAFIAARRERLGQVPGPTDRTDPGPAGPVLAGTITDGDHPEGQS
jgi:hypothetical protein